MKHAQPILATSGHVHEVVRTLIRRDADWSRTMAPEPILAAAPQGEPARGSSGCTDPPPDRRSESLSEDVRRVLRSALLKDPYLATEVARLFAMHPRTFSRHLAAEGATFQKLVDEIRFEIARHLLANTGKSPSQVATVLRFSEPSAFTRAFRRWSGQPPSAWQASHAGGRWQEGGCSGAVRGRKASGIGSPEAVTSAAMPNQHGVGPGTTFRRSGNLAPAPPTLCRRQSSRAARSAGIP
jgi:AraC-like DNA-binding protein